MSDVIKPGMARPAINRATQWPDTVNILLGLWLIVSPWMLGLPADNAPAVNIYLAGFFIATIATFALWYHARWQEWTLAGVGAWLAVSPWVLGFFSPATAATYNALIVGLSVAALAWRAAMSERVPAPPPAAPRKKAA